MLRQGEGSGAVRSSSHVVRRLGENFLVEEKENVNGDSLKSFKGSISSFSPSSPNRPLDSPNTSTTNVTASKVEKSALRVRESETERKRKLT